MTMTWEFALTFATIFRTVTATFHYEIFLKSLNKLFCRHSVEVLNYSIVVNNLQLACRECNCHKEIVLFITCVVRIGCFFFCTDEGGGGSSVMTVSYIKCRYGGENLSDSFNGSIVIDYPKMVTESIFCHEIVFCRLFNSLGNDGIDLFIVGICEENGLYIGILDAYMNHTIFFFIFTSKLMFFDFAGEIILYIGT